MVTLPLEYIKKIGIIRQFKDLFTEFSGLDFDFLNIDDILIPFPCSLKNGKKTRCSTYQPPDCNQISQNILNELVSSKKTQVFMCSGGMRKVVIPLSLSGNVIGILFVGENEFLQLDKTKLDAISSLLSRLTNYIIENESVSLKYFKGSLLTRQQQQLIKVIRYIRMNYHRNHLTLKEVSRENAISYHYLSHLFKKELNTTFIQYCHKVKMDMAVRLLKDFRLSISQVSYTCGFEDSSYFCKVFKIYYGCSPGEYRQKIILRRNQQYKKRYSNYKLKIKYIEAERI